MTSDEIVKLLDQHTPSITDDIEGDLQTRIEGAFGAAEYDADLEAIADCALRVCACGKTVDGFYEYVDHLKEVIGAR